MTNYHQTDPQGIYTTTVQIDPMAPLPGSGTLTPPPDADLRRETRWDVPHHNEAVMP